MNRKHTPLKAQPMTLVEALEPRIAPAGLLNETKFTSVVVGGSVLLDASGGPGDSQGLSTAFGSYAGSYLLYLNAGKALVFTTDLNGNGILDPGEITGIALAPDSLGRAPKLTLFSDVKGDIVTNLNPGHFNNTLTDSDNNANNGRDGRALLNTNIDSIVTRTLTAADIDTTVPGNTVSNRLALTHFSIYGNIIAGGDINQVRIDDSGSGALAAKFPPGGSFGFSGAQITIGGVLTGTAANYQYYHFTQNSPQLVSGTAPGTQTLTNVNVEGQLQQYLPAPNQHGGNISDVAAASATTSFSLPLIASGDGGAGAAGGNITGVVMHGATGSYSILAGNGGQGSVGGHGGNIVGFSDTTTITGQAFIHSGNGGRGTLGAGGDGGTADFTTVNNASNFQVVLGAGGAGFTRGGNGAGLAGTVFSNPDVTVPLGGKIVGTWHDIGDVGNTHPIGTDPATGATIYSPEVIDFDGDGNGDAVFSTTNPGQVVVVFGDGLGAITDNTGARFGGAPSKTVILNVPGGGTPVFTVGDFNGDGKPDIAVASNDPNNFGGVSVYLNQIGDTRLNVVNATNYTHNPLGDHPFSNALQSGVPTLNNFGYAIQGGAIGALAAGDFNGDGITDIAYAQTVGSGRVVGILFGDQATALNTRADIVGAHTAPTPVNGTVPNGLINNATGRPQGTGFFYSNAVGTANSPSGVQVSAAVPGTDPVVLHATSVSSGNVPTVAGGGRPAAPEVVLAGNQTALGIRVYAVNMPSPVTHIPAVAGLNEDNSFGLGIVDTNRLLNTPTQQNFTPQTFTLQDFQIADVDQDGRADVVALSAQPQTFLQTFRGDGTGAFVTVSGTGGDNSGIDLGNYPTVAPPAIALAVADPLHSGRFDGFAVENLGAGASSIREFRLTAGASGDPLALDSVIVDTAAYGISPTADRQIAALDAFYPTAPVIDKATNTPVANLHPANGYAALSPTISSVLYANANFLSIQNGAAFAFARYLTQNGLSIFSGDGGSSTNGVGGNAGKIGDGSLSFTPDATATASVELLYTASAAYQGDTVLRGGNGGNGFGGGGLGGDITGVITRYNLTTTGGASISTTSLQAGNGGNGIGGDGGRGGNLSFLSILNGENFFSGNGGNGSNGGAGGSILGNQSGFDTSNAIVTLSTGFGGQGANSGGAGGTINRWSSQISSFGGSVLYQTGRGGTAAGGLGGAGGSILDSPLSVDLDRLDGSLTLLTGVGGAGLTGGAGGSITNFTNSATEQAAIPSTLTVITGGGGVGVTGSGGAGGNINTFQSNAVGFTALNQFTGLVRIIAGDGGLSFGAKGGAGGSLSNINATATSTPLVAAAGQGGNGLTVGGAGGSVTNTVLNSAATQIGKLLVVAGKGGDALSALPSDIALPNDFDVTDLAHAVLAFGGQTGQGGDGGSVINLRQPASTQTAVDIIAGNGGDTINAGVVTSVTSGVGRGGSISNVALTGTLGSLQRNTVLGQVATPQIKSYSALDPLTGGQTSGISDFVNFLARDSNALYVLDDSSGNVGMVAGAAGSIRGGQPASNGVNGSVTTVQASSILSIVAGSVESVAPVSVLSNVVFTSPDGVLGADKSPNAPFGPNGALDYYNTQGVNVAELRAGYRLIDGAIFATTISSTPLSPRVFTTNGG